MHLFFIYSRIESPHHMFILLNVAVDIVQTLLFIGQQIIL